MTLHVTRTPTLHEKGGNPIAEKKRLKGSGVICKRCEIRVFERVIVKEGELFTADNQIARVLEDGVLCAACVKEEKPA